jgi:hypothetical protein
MKSLSIVSVFVVALAAVALLLMPGLVSAEGTTWYLWGSDHYFPGVPTADALDQQYTTGASAASGVMSTSWLAQTFTPATSHTLNTVSLQLYKVGSPAYTVTINLYAAGADDKPTGSPLASTTFLASSLTTTSTWYDYQFPTGYALAAGTKYALVLSATGGASGTMAYWRVNTAGTYGGGMKASSADQGVAWTTNSAADFMFKEGHSLTVWHEQYTTGASAASGVMSSSWLAQTFTPMTSHTLNTVSLQLYKVGSPTYTVAISLCASGADDKPTGSALASTTFLASSLATSATWYEFQLSTGCEVTTGTKYAIVLSATEGASGNLVYWRVNTAGGYSRGMKATSANQGTSWTATSAHDFMFKEGQSAGLAYVMSLTDYMDDDNNASGDVSIQPSKSVTWIADEATLVDTTLPAATWNAGLYIPNGAGTCTVKIGKWVPGSEVGGGTFHSAGSAQLDFQGAAAPENTLAVGVDAIDIGAGQHVAFQVTTTANEASLQLGSAPNYGLCWIGDPSSAPTDPVPELPTLLLLGAGLVGVAAFAGWSVWRRRSPA